MVDKNLIYDKGAQKIMTYSDAIDMFNNLNDTLGADGFYRFQEKLRDVSGNLVPGFWYKGYMAGQGLRNVLDNLGIKYTTRIKSGTGINEESEILIAPESVAKMVDIYKKIGIMQARQRIEINHKLEKRSDFLDKSIPR